MTIRVLTKYQIDELSKIIRYHNVEHLGISEETNELVVEYESIQYKGGINYPVSKTIKISPSNSLPNG